MGGTANQNINVKLTLEDQGGTSAWHMEIVGQGKGGPNHYPPAKAAHGSAADFTFVITGQGTQGITFAKTDPIWVAVDNGTGKSPAGAGINTDQIGNVSGGGGKVLSFTDYNSNPPVNLTYQLNFDGGGKPLDPIIQNDGGGPPHIQHYEYLYAAGALLVAIFAFVLLRKRFMKPAVMRDENGSL